MDRTKLFIVIGAVAVIIIIFLLLFLLLGNINDQGPGEAVTLQMWGVFDDPNYYSEAIRTFEAENPNIHIIYRSFNYEDYEKELINSFAAGTGPDIWLMHNTWLAKHADKIQPMPLITGADKKPLMTFKDFQDQFVDVAINDLTLGDQIYALPLYVDTLALYYNKDIFNTVGITRPPRTYEEVNDQVARMTQLDKAGNVTRSGIALGTSQNVNRSSDIMMMLMLQSGVQMTDVQRSAATFSKPINNQSVGEIALRYYTDFANPSKQVYTWTPQQDYSIDAFVNGETAMMVNYSHHIGTIRSKSARFNFGVAPIPQLSDAPKALAFANYWAPTVSKQSQRGLEAWRFLIYLSSFKGAASYVNVANRPSARRDYIDQQKNDLDLGPFALQALFARSWYQIDNTAIEKIFTDMIDAINFGRLDTREALRAAETQVSVLMQRARR